MTVFDTVLGTLKSPRNRIIALCCALAVVLVAIASGWWWQYVAPAQERVREADSVLRSAGLLAPKPSTAATPLPTASSVSDDQSTSTTATTPIPSPSPLPPIPEQSQLSDGSHVFQTFNNCGPASLHMTLSYFGRDISQATLGDQLRPFQNPQGINDDKSVSLAEIAAWGDANGFTSYHRAAGTIKVLQRLVAADIPVVTRTWLNGEDDIGHFRVVVGYDQATDELIQDDSLQGDDLRYSYDAFDELWEPFSREFLVLARDEQRDTVERILGPRSDETTSWRLAKQTALQQLQEDPDALWPRFNLGVAEYQLGNPEAAVAAYDQVRERIPSRTLWYRVEPLIALYQIEAYDRVFEQTAMIFQSQNRAYSELYALRAAMFAEQDQATAANEARAAARRYNSAPYWRENIPAPILETAGL